MIYSQAFWLFSIGASLKAVDVYPAYLLLLLHGEL